MPSRPQWPSTGAPPSSLLPQPASGRLHSVGGVTSPGGSALHSGRQAAEVGESKAGSERCAGQGGQRAGADLEGSAAPSLAPQGVPSPAPMMLGHTRARPAAGGQLAGKDGARTHGLLSFIITAIDTSSALDKRGARQPLITTHPKTSVHPAVLLCSA